MCLCGKLDYTLWEKGNWRKKYTKSEDILWRERAMKKEFFVKMFY